MGKISKLLAVALATVSLGTSVFAQETAKAVPGAVLMPYSLVNNAVRPAPDADPITAVVDNSTKFSNLNLSANTETSHLAGQNLFLVWNGYITIPQEGPYTFSLSYERHPWDTFNTIMQINGKDFLEISGFDGRVKANDARTLVLGKGNYEITLIHRYTRANDCGNFRLRMWHKSNPLKKFAITPASMVHAE